MKKVSKGHHSSLNELNITPLLDLAFVLLVIFIITTPLTVEKSGQIMLNNQTIELAALKPMLVAMKASDPETTIVVRGAADVEYQRMISVLDALQQADITKIGLATETTQ